jgi:hypothetical protein
MMTLTVSLLLIGILGVARASSVQDVLVKKIIFLTNISLKHTQYVIAIRIKSKKTEKLATQNAKLYAYAPPTPQ